MVTAEVEKWGVGGLIFLLAWFEKRHLEEFERD